MKLFQNTNGTVEWGIFVHDKLIFACSVQLIETKTMWKWIWSFWTQKKHILTRQSKQFLTHAVIFASKRSEKKRVTQLQKRAKSNPRIWVTLYLAVAFYLSKLSESVVQNDKKIIVLCSQLTYELCKREKIHVQFFMCFELKL